jgi:hypothetical protein
MIVLELTGEKVNVFPFSEQLSAVKNIPIATVATIWEEPQTGELWLLIIHEALYFGATLRESLLCPNQLRANGVLVEDTPVQFDPSSLHSIVVSDDLRIPLELHGVASSFRSRLPTSEELERYYAGELQSVELTSDQPWEPYSTKFAEMEAHARARTASTLHVTRPRRTTDQWDDKAEEESEPENVVYETPRRLLNPAMEERCLALLSRLSISQSTPDMWNETDIGDRLIARINVTSTDADGDGLHFGQEPLFSVSQEDRNVCSMSSRERGPVVTKEILSRRWGIGLDTAHRTLEATTQKGVRRVLHPIERRYKTRQTHLRFPTL